mgnify:CR=1 FL=1
MPKKAKEEGKKLKVTVFLIKEGYAKVDDFVDLNGDFRRLEVNADGADGERRDRLRGITGTARFRLGLRAMFAGTLANFLTATIAGMLL